MIILKEIILLKAEVIIYYHRKLLSGYVVLQKQQLVSIYTTRYIWIRLYIVNVACGLLDPDISSSQVFLVLSPCIFQSVPTFSLLAD